MSGFTALGFAALLHALSRPTNGEDPTTPPPPPPFEGACCRFPDGSVIELDHLICRAAGGTPIACPPKNGNGPTLPPANGRIEEPIIVEPPLPPIEPPTDPTTEPPILPFEPPLPPIEPVTAPTVIPLPPIVAPTTPTTTAVSPTLGVSLDPGGVAIEPTPNLAGTGLRGFKWGGFTFWGRTGQVVAIPPPGSRYMIPRLYRIPAPEGAVILHTF